MKDRPRKGRVERADLTRDLPRHDQEGVAGQPQLGPFRGSLTSEEAKQVDARYEKIKSRPSVFEELAGLDRAALEARGRSDGVDLDCSHGSDSDLRHALLRRAVESEGLALADGILELLPEGYGFLRSHRTDFLASPDDIYVSPSQVRRFSMRPGQGVWGAARPPKPNEAFSALLRVESVDGQAPSLARRRPRFDDLVPIHPRARYRLEHDGGPASMRVLDLVCPIGKGQRGLIVAPPRTGKTILLTEIAQAIKRNDPAVVLLVLLIDERPEEVTEVKRSVQGEVIASTFDEQSRRHLQVAEVVLQRARRMVEAGSDVVVLLDSITRLARAYNADLPSTGRILSGGVDAAALQRPKRFFGAARAIEGGGSLTVIATALVDTGSRMDEVIFEEFKGTGNLEIVLDRRLSDRRIFPSIDLHRSGTRREELMLPPETVKRMAILRQVMGSMDPAEAMQLLLERLRRTRTNDEFLKSMAV